MDNENIAVILKDAINASSTKIQSESKRTKVFVLPPELLKGLLVKNEIPKKTDNSTSTAETSNTKNNKKTISNKKQSSENSKSAASPVDQPKPKRTYNRKSTANKDVKNTKPQKSSTSNSTGVKNVEQNNEQNAVLGNDEICDTSKAVEKVTIQKKSNRGRKPKTKKENETCNADKWEDPQTILDNNQENSTEITHEFNDYSINDKLLDNCSKEKCSVEILDKVEEKSSETNHELQDYSTNEISNNVIQQNNLTNPETVVSSCEEKLCDEKVKVDDKETEVIDQVLQDPHIEIFQSGASQKILNGETSSHIELNDEKGVNALSSKPIEFHNNEESTIIEEETYILEEIIEIEESDEEQVSEANDLAKKSEENNVQNIDPPTPISAPIIIKSEPIFKTRSINFEPIIEQKRSNTTRVYVNKRKSRKVTGTVEVQEKSIPQINDNSNEVSLIDLTPKEISLENFGEESQNLQKNHEKFKSEIDSNYDYTIPKSEIEEKFISEVNCDFVQDVFIDSVLTGAPIKDFYEESHKDHEKFETNIDCDYKIEDKIIPEENCDVDQHNFNNSFPTETPAEDFCEQSKNSLDTSEESISEKESKSGEKCLTYIARTEITTKNQCQEITYFEVQQESNSDIDTSLIETVNSRKELRLSQQVKAESSLEIDSSFDQSNSSESASTENPNQNVKCLKSSEEKIDTEIHHETGNISLDTVTAETSKINSHEELKQEETVVISENNIANDTEKTGNENEMPVPTETLVESLHDLSGNAEEFLNTQSGELPKSSSVSNVKSDLEQATAVSADTSKTNNSCNNNDLGNTKDHWENEQNCSIRSLRQLRNRAKVVPQDPENFNKLKNHIEKESLQLKNSGKSDIIVRYDFDCSKRTRSVSLNLAPESSEKLSRVAKKLSRKPKSTDNYLEKTSRMIALRRRSAFLQNEIKLPQVLEQDSKESLSNEAVGCEKNEIDNNQTKLVKTVVYDSMIAKNMETTVIEKDGQLITSDSHLSEKSSRSIDFSKETAIDQDNLKREKVIVVRKIKKGRRSKSSQSKDDPAEATDEQRSAICDNEIKSNIVQLEIPKTAKNTILLEDSVEVKTNCSPTDPSNCQENIAVEEPLLNIKREKVTPIKRGRRRLLAKPILPKTSTAKVPQEDFNVNKNNQHEIDKVDCLQDHETIENNIATSKSLKADEISVSNPTGTPNVDSQVEEVLEESTLNIKTEKVSPPFKRGRRGRRPKSISSNVNVEDSVANNTKIDENAILSKDNMDNELECNLVDTQVPEKQVENALDDSILEIKTEKVVPVIRGRRGRRPKSMLSRNNAAVENNKEDDFECNKNNPDVDVSENIRPKDGLLANQIVTSAEIHEHAESVRVSDDLDYKSKADHKMENSAVQDSSEITNEKLSPVKKGRRGRRSKFSRTDDVIEMDSVTSIVENNIDLHENDIMQIEEVDKNSIAEKSVHSNMEIDTAIGDDNPAHDSDSETIENSGKGSSKLCRRSSRHDKQEASNTSDTQTSAKRPGRRSSKINVKHDTVDIDDEPKNMGKDSSNMSLRKSGRRQRSSVNYCVPDEDVDVYDSEKRIAKDPSESAPKKRRGRPSKQELLMRLNASIEEKREKESTQKDTTVDAAVDDVHSSPVEASNTSTRKRRSTKRSTKDEDIFEMESKPTKQEESDDSPDRSQTESLRDAADDTNDFEDSHVSAKCDDDEDDEESDVAKEVQSRRGRKRKYSFQPHLSERKRGRPPLKKNVKKNDDDYTPHHSYVPRPTKVKAKSKESPSKKIVKCGKCEKEVPKNQWYSHNLYSHNDMGWLAGMEKPDFENDSKLLMRVLTAAHKKKNKKGLICETCREVKKSVVGFISHVTFCGKTDAEIESLLVTCDQCGAKFKPSSMEYHERQHRLEIEGKKKKEKALAEKEIDIFEPRSKRKAAEKAVSKISEFTALVKDDDGCSATKKLKLSSPHIKKFIQKPLATKRISSLLIAKWKRELDNKQDAACTQLGCQFTCKSMDEIREHYATCNFTVTENYVCKVCHYQTLYADEIIKHAAEKHTSEDLDINAAMSDTEDSESEDYSDYYDEDSSNKSQGLVKKFFYKETSEIENKMFKFIFNNGACHTVLNKTFIPGFQWTLEFERKHFKFNIFDDFTPNAFALLEEEEAENYLPELELSLPVKFMKKDGQLNEPEWRKWSMFESARVDDCPTLFVGGPVWAMAWAPTPSYLAISDDLPQFLAISTHPKMDFEYSVGESYSGKNIIQIWNVGKLNNRNASESDPILSYSIAHEGGTVWSLEWCPSGCYQHEDFSELKNESNTNRLGLLAAGCSDGCVRIYSLVFPQDLADSPNENQHPIYNTEPVMQLIISSDMYENNEHNWQVMKLNWSREANHNVIVAGLSNGYVALWDLTTKSPMLKYKVNNTTFFRPYKQFFAHHHAVTMVALVPQDNKRYLATASLDKLYKFWDLEDISRPKNTYKKSYITDGAWFNNWCCAVIVHDNALCTNGNNSAVCLPLRDYTYKYYNILPSNSTIYGVSTSDFGNSVATGNVAGELLSIFPHQLIYIRDMEKTIPPKRSCSLVSTTELVDFEAEQDPSNKAPVKRGKKAKSDPYSDPTQFMPSTYKDSKDRFGILFNNKINPLKSNSKSVQKYKKKPTLTCEQLEQTPIEMYPIKSINKVAWNPNASSFLWLAAGYQNGFVRLISFRSVASTAEWNKLLQLHTNALNAQMTKTAADDDSS